MVSHVIAIRRGRIDWNDLLDGTTGMSDNRDGDLSLHIADQDELIPIAVALIPGGVGTKAILTGIASRATNITERVMLLRATLHIFCKN